MWIIKERERAVSFEASTLSRAIGGTKPDWFPDWSDEYVAVVAAGPSVTQEQVNLLRDRIHTVVINSSYELCLWADALYSCDEKWWFYKDGAKDFTGLKVSQGGEASKVYPEIKNLTIAMCENIPKSHSKRLMMNKYGEIGGGGHSGFQVMNWMAQIGVAGMLLIGYDMRVDGNGKNHWHGRHPESGKHILNNPGDNNFRNWIPWMEAASVRLKSLGIEIVNCSEKSALTCFPKMSVEQVLERWRL